MKSNIFKNKFVSSTLILLIGGFISKILGFFIRVMITRYIGVEGTGLYSMLMPTFSLFIVFATFSFPIAISKLVATPNRSSKKIIFSIIPISFILNIISILLLFVIASPLATYFLKDSRLIYPIICIGFTLPFIGLSSIVKGYFWGKQRMFPYILSNIGEQLIRIVILLLVIPHTIEISLTLTIAVIILVNIVSEIVSIIIMLLFMPKGSVIRKEDLLPDKDNIKDVMEISVPTTSSKVLGSISYFFEPIILTNLLLLNGFGSDYILAEYGILNGYVLGLLMIPQFFTQSLSTSLVPELSKYYSVGNKSKCKKRIVQIGGLSLVIGSLSTFLLMLFPDFFLNLIYNTNLGINYMKILGPFMLLYFIDMPLQNSLQAMNRSKDCLYITIITSISKLSILSLCIFLNLGMTSLVISIIVSLFISTILHLRVIAKVLR